MAQREHFNLHQQDKGANAVLWTGRSGRRYAMTRERSASAALAPARLYARI